MEYNKLYGLTLLLLLVGMIIGVGVLTLDKFSTAVKESTNVVNETITIASSTATLTNDDVTAFTFFGNGTNDTAAGGLVIGNHINYTAAGVITVDASTIGDSKYNVSYTYGADSTASTAIDSGRTELSTIASSWLGLIVTVAILAIILTLVFAGFGGRRY